MKRVCCIVGLVSMMWAMSSVGFAPAFAAAFAAAPKKKPKPKEPPKPPPPASYTKEIKPLLDKYCLGCHNNDLKQGMFILETYDELMKGGKSGVVIVPGKSAESLLYKALTAAKDVVPMPPKGTLAPSAKDIALIKRWIDEGAKNDAPPAETKEPGKS